MSAQVARGLSESRRHNRFICTIDAISRMCGGIASTMIVLAVFITCQMIFVRFVLNASTVWQTEMVIYLVIAATLIGLPFVQNLRGHVNVNLLPIYLSQSARFGLALLTLLLSGLIVCVMFIYGVEFWYQAFSRGWTSDTVWAVRLWIPYLAIPVGFGLLLLQLVADMVAVLQKLDRPFGLGEG